MTEPLLGRLQRRGETLCVAALPWVAPVYRAMPQVQEVIELPFAHGGLQWRARRQLARQMQGRFDAAYVLPNSLKSALLPFLAGIPKRIGYLGEARVGLLTQRLKNPPKARRPPMVQWYSRLSGESDTADDVPRLHLEARQVDEVLQELGLERGKFVVFAPGAEFGPAKRWPSARFAELARRMGQTVLLLGSGKEQAICEEIEGAAGPSCRNLCGKTSLAQALALLSAAAAVVSNDSGLMHVAAAFGVRQVALFGSSSPLHTPPLNPQAQVVWLKDDPQYQPPLDCSPCFKRECPLGHTRCLVDIDAARVLSLLSPRDRGATASE